MTAGQLAVAWVYAACVFSAPTIAFAFVVAMFVEVAADEALPAPLSLALAVAALATLVPTFVLGVCALSMWATAFGCALELFL